MSVARLCALSSLLFLTVVSLSGQQKPAASATGAPQAAASRATGNLEHGRYLVEQVIMCWECHSSARPAGQHRGRHEVQGWRDACSSDLQRRLAESDPADRRSSWL